MNPGANLTRVFGRFEEGLWHEMILNQMQRAIILCFQLDQAETNCCMAMYNV